MFTITNHGSHGRLYLPTILTTIRGAHSCTAFAYNRGKQRQGRLARVQGGSGLGGPGSEETAWCPTAGVSKPNCVWAMFQMGAVGGREIG